MNAVAIRAALDELAALYPEDGLGLLASSPPLFLRRVADEIKRLRADNAVKMMEQELLWATRDVPESQKEMPR